MNDADVSKQIQQMVKFIRQEAQAEELNASHIKVLQAQDAAVNVMKDAASKELLHVSDDKCTYKALLKGLIIQLLICCDGWHFGCELMENSGGVVLASQDGKIVCESTLDARLDLVFRQKLPEIRKHLCG